MEHRWQAVVRIAERAEQAFEATERKIDLGGMQIVRLAE
jgi:hypothetical protein